MNELTETKASIDRKSAIRDSIMEFESILLEQPNSFVGDSDICPLKHTFSDGIYVREIFIPKGTILTGKIHIHDHPNFLMSGEVEVITETGGVEHLIAPVSMISPKGTKRIVRSIKDSVWITVHSNPTNIQDLSKLEAIIIAKFYGDLKKISFKQKIKQLFTKNKIL